MAWTDLTFTYGAVLTSAQMTQLDDNFDALAAGDSGAPSIVYAALSLSNDIVQGDIAASAIGQSELKASSGTISISSGGTNATLPGGEWGFFPQGKKGNYNAYWGASGSSGGTPVYAAQYSSSSYVTKVYFYTYGATPAYMKQRYVQASPPYDHGDGVVAQYVFAVLDKSGNVESTYVAEDAPWHNNGPTDVRAKVYDKQGRGWRWEDELESVLEQEDLTDYATACISAGWVSVKDPIYVDVLSAGYKGCTYPKFLHPKSGLYSAAQSWKELCIEQNIKVQQLLGGTITRKRPTGKKLLTEVTQDIKNADMPLIPHPFLGNDLTEKTVVLLDMVSDQSHRLLERSKYEGFDVAEALHTGTIQVSNTGLTRSGPPDVMVVPFTLK